MRYKNGRRDQTPPLFTSSESTTLSKSSILKKKFELKIAEQKCEEEIEFLRAEARRPAELLELKKKAEESRLEYLYEDALAQDERTGMSVNGDIKDHKELRELPIDSVNDRVSRLDYASNTEKAVADKPLTWQINLTKPEDVGDVVNEPRKTEASKPCVTKGLAEEEACATS